MLKPRSQSTTFRHVLPATNRPSLAGRLNQNNAKEAPTIQQHFQADDKLCPQYLHVQPFETDTSNLCQALRNDVRTNDYRLRPECFYCCLIVVTIRAVRRPRRQFVGAAADLFLIGAPPPIICRRAADAMLVCLIILLHFYALHDFAINGCLSAK